MKSKPMFVLFSLFFLVTLGLTQTVFAQNTQVTTNTSRGVHLGNMGITSVGNQPIMSMIKGTVSDGSTQVIISYSPAPPASGQPLSIVLTFVDAKGNLIQHQNYAISVTQDGKDVLSNAVGHTHTGNDIQMTSNLTTSNAVDIQVTLNGVGLPGTDPSTWTGPKGAVLMFNVVPEFGLVAPFVLVIVIISVIIISSRTSGFLKL